jgi:hypothetical protein
MEMTQRGDGQVKKAPLVVPLKTQRVVIPTLALQGSRIGLKALCPGARLGSKVWRYSSLVVGGRVSPFLLS